MTVDIIQKNCPKCGLRAIKIDRDKLGTRHCPDPACGTTWFPVKNPEPKPAPKKDGEE